MSEEEEKQQEDELEQDKPGVEQADELLNYAYDPLQMIDMIAPQAQRALIKSCIIFKNYYKKKYTGE